VLADFNGLDLLSEGGTVSVMVESEIQLRDLLRGEEATPFDMRDERRLRWDGFHRSVSYLVPYLPVTPTSASEVSQWVRRHRRQRQILTLSALGHLGGLM
jgi:hypothetical protein